MVLQKRQVQFFIKTNKKIIFDRIKNTRVIFSDGNKNNGSLCTPVDTIHELYLHVVLPRKKITVKNTVKFEINETQTIELSELSSGEKQLLILLFTVFVQDEKPCIFLLDEPEISLHMEWQSVLIKTLVTLNPNAQFIIVTHVSSIFGKGWGDKLTWMEDILQ